MHIKHWAQVMGSTLALLATLSNGATQHGPALLLRAIIAVLVVVIWPRSAVTLRWRDMVAPVLGFTLVSVGWAMSPEGGVAAQLWVTVVLVVTLYTALLAAERDWSGNVLLVAGSIGIMHSVLAVGQRLLMGTPRAAGGFFSPNDLAAFLAPLLLLCGHAARRALPHRNGYLYAGAACCLALGLWATASRAGVMAAAVGGVIWSMPRWRQRPRLVVLAATVAVAVYFLLRARWQDADPYAYARWSIWTSSIRVLLKYPFGVGLGHYAEIMRMQGIPIADWVRYPHLANNAHNELLQAAVELGWAGAVVLLVGLGLLVACVRSQFEAALHLGVLATLLIPALTSASLHVPPVAFLTATWAARVARFDGRRGVEWRVPCMIPYLSLAALLVALPGCLGAVMMQQAAAARGRHDLKRAQELAHVAVHLTPWSLGAAMLEESLRFVAGAPRAEVAQRLISLADRFPSAPEPWTRAAEVLADQAENVPQRWHIVAQLWEQAAERDPHNALTWNRVGEAHWQAGDTLAAKRAWARAVAEEPYCARALKHLGEHAPTPQERDSLLQAAQTAAKQAPRYKGYARTVLTLDGVSAQ